MTPKEVILNIGDIREEFFVRAKLNEDHALYLAELIEANIKLPPIEVAYLEDNDRPVLVDGRHRLHAYGTVLDRKSIPAIVVKGTKEELILRAMRANTGGALSTGGADINLVIKQLLGMGVSKVKIVQQMSTPHLPFTPSLIRRHLETVGQQMTRDKLVAAQHAVVEGMTTVEAARKFDVPLARLQTVLGGSRSKKKKAQIQDLAQQITKSAFARSKIINNTLNKALDMFDDGELRASQVEKLLEQVEGLNKRAFKLHNNMVVRFQERKKLLKERVEVA